MPESLPPIIELLREDQRYSLDAYQFVREALAYAQEEKDADEGEAAAQKSPAKPNETHITGQQLCWAMRDYAVDQFGYMAKVVLGSWGVHNTGDFGEIVYNLIRIKEMKKSKTDRREDFDDVYNFDEAFHASFQITMPE